MYAEKPSLPPAQNLSPHGTHGIAPRDLLLLLGINLIWGLNLIVSKIGLLAQIPVHPLHAAALFDPRGGA